MINIIPVYQRSFLLSISINKILHYIFDVIIILVIIILGNTIISKAQKNDREKCPKNDILK